MISIADVLELVGFVACKSSGNQLRGPCIFLFFSVYYYQQFSVNLD